MRFYRTVMDNDTNGWHWVAWRGIQAGTVGGYSNGSFGITQGTVSARQQYEIHSYRSGRWETSTTMADMVDWTASKQWTRHVVLL